MMREVWYCDTCGAETGFVINGHPYCAEHAVDGIEVQIRLVASLNGMTGEELERASEWAMAEMARVLGTPGSSI